MEASSLKAALEQRHCATIWKIPKAIFESPEDREANATAQSKKYSHRAENATYDSSKQKRLCVCITIRAMKAEQSSDT